MKKKVQQQPLRQCPVTHLPVRTQPGWNIRHEEADYTAAFETIGPDIVHAQVVTDHDTVLDYMDIEMFESVCNELGIIGKATYVIINLNHIREILLSYKKDFANLIYNRGPIFTVLAMYNVHPDIQLVTEAVAALCPDNTCAFIADDYHQAILGIMEYRSNPDRPVHDDDVTGSDASVKKAFLNALARMCWIDMLELPVPMPAEDHEFHPLFLAVEELRKDMLAKEEKHQKKIEQIKEDGRQKLELNKILLNAKLDLHSKHACRFEHEITDLKKTIACREAELAQISAVAEEKADLLGRMYEEIKTANISTEQKEHLIGHCRKMIDSGTIEQQFRMELTKTDSRFLSLLKKENPSLSEKELRLSLLIKLDYDTREIARSTGLSKRGIETVRYRLHKKLGLQKHQSMKRYFASLSEKSRQEI
ncbi:MAG: LuxR family transcriptional regulator [Chlorobium sp.]|uniref:helix-turn-helix transcriptional regulator n=1 Tax=Chlorobium sp. TaxID=1095 RepID=UPI0025C65739|nr:LuxR family transcriptional regulator [Chlorobium sp.]MCF8383941.1 LuxR family transcriptional regulator [Chlorobium sp.]